MAGAVVAGGGDINGDGLDDVIDSAPFDDPNGLSSGAVFVVFGKADGAVVELSAVESGTGGFAINGISAENYIGSSVDIAGDVNSDGLDDVIVQSGSAGTNGQAYVIFGKADTATVELSDIVATGMDGFVMNGAASDAIYAVSGAGDLNGDGLSDLIVGSRYNNLNGYEAGAAYVIYGRAA